MTVLATDTTDAPLDARQLRRLGVQVAAGLARTGSHLGPTSGDFVIAFSTAERIEHAPPALTKTRTVIADERSAMAALFPTVIESVEEAILNSLCRAETMVGRDGNTGYAVPIEEMAGLVRKGTV